MILPDGAGCKLTYRSVPRARPEPKRCGPPPITGDVTLVTVSSGRRVVRLAPEAMTFRYSLIGFMLLWFRWHLVGQPQGQEGVGAARLVRIGGGAG